MTELHPASASAEDVRDLSQAEHLLLFGFRATAMGHGDCPAMHRTFHGLLGREADAALGHLLIFVRVVGSAGGRRVRLHPPGCCSLSADERLVLDVVTAAQATLSGHDEASLRSALHELLAREPGETALMAAQMLAASLMVGGLHLHEPQAAAKGRPTLH